MYHIHRKLILIFRRYRQGGTEMSIKKLDENQRAKFNQCRTQDDYRGFVKDLGYELSEADLDAVCGGLSDLNSDEAYMIMAERLDGAIAKSGVIW